MKTVLTKAGVVVGIGQAMMDGVVVSHPDSDAEYTVPAATKAEMGWFLQPDGSFAETSHVPQDPAPQTQPE